MVLKTQKVFRSVIIKRVILNIVEIYLVIIALFYQFLYLDDKRSDLIDFHWRPRVLGDPFRVIWWLLKIFHIDLLIIQVFELIKFFDHPIQVFGVTFQLGLSHFDRDRDLTVSHLCFDL